MKAKIGRQRLTANNLKGNIETKSALRQNASGDLKFSAYVHQRTFGKHY